MTLQELINQEKNNPNWTSKKVFICYSNDTILRKRALGNNICDGELFSIEDLDEYCLNQEVKSNQWWYEGGDLCVDTYRTW